MRRLRLQSILLLVGLSACAGAVDSERAAPATGGDGAGASEAVGAEGGHAGQESEGGASGASGFTDDQVRQLLIDESIAAYDGPCPCPDSIDAAGHRCGARSAYSRDGGASPLCSPGDVTDEMVREWRDKHPEN